MSPVGPTTVVTLSTCTFGGNGRGASAAQAAKATQHASAEREALRRSTFRGSRSDESNIESKMDHVAIAHDIVLAFETHLAGFLGALLALVSDVIVERDHFGADESFLEIGVDDAGRLRRR